MERRTVFPREREVDLNVIAQPGTQIPLVFPREREVDLNTSAMDGLNGAVKSSLVRGKWI